MEEQIDQLHINFDSEALWTLNLALALVMFGIALELRPSDFTRILRNPRPVLTGVCCQFLLLPALTFLLVWWWEPFPSFALGMILVASCPGGNVSNFMSHLAGGNTALSVSLTAFATLLAVVMTPLNLQVWGGLYEPSAALLTEVRIDLWEMVRLVAVIPKPLKINPTENDDWLKWKARWILDALKRYAYIDQVQYQATYDRFQ